MGKTLKEFDKWNINQERVIPSDKGRLYTLVDYERKRAWKAALKWALLTGSWETVAKEIKEEIYKTDAKT